MSNTHHLILYGCKDGDGSILASIGKAKEVISQRELWVVYCVQQEHAFISLYSLGRYHTI
jgi:hypothetical protein